MASVAVVSLILTITTLTGGSSAEPSGTAASATAPVGVAATSAATSPASASAGPTLSPKPLPTATLAVGVRTIQLDRGPGRPLPTTIWYPAQGRAGGNPKTNAQVARGRFPLVLFSHGISGLPAYSQQLTIPLAAAGFIVAAPTYPLTHDKADPFDANDVENQPADASLVISTVLGLDAKLGDLFAGHLDGSVAAAGFSGGAITTAGLLGRYRDPRVSAGIIIAGARMGSFQGPDAALLFIHGDEDAVITYDRGLSAYQSTSWPKAFITMQGQGHGDYLRSGKRGYTQVIRSMIAFLRWSVYGDPASKDRVRRDASTSFTSFEAAW